MSKHLNFQNQKRYNVTPRKLCGWAIHVLVLIMLTYSFVGVGPAPVLAAGTIYYVDNTNPACSESNTGPQGTIDVPFCTLGRGALKAVIPGDIVQVIAGTYAETVFLMNSGIDGEPITFQANPGVTVTGNNSSGFMIGGQSYVVIDGFNVTATLDKGIQVIDSNHITISNNHVSFAGDPANPGLHVQGIYLKNTTYSTVTGNTTDHNTCIGIRLVNGSNYNTVSENISYANASVVVSDAAGIELTGASYNTVINNITFGNEDSGINLYVNSSGMASSNNYIIGNLSYGNGDHGIDHNNSPYNTVVGNTVHGNGTVGINFEGDAGLGSHHATIANNISAGNGLTPLTGSFGGNLRVDTNSVTGTVLDYDIFYRQSAPVQIIWNNTSYTTLAAFRTAVPGQEINGLEANPLFVAPVAPVLRQDGVPFLGNSVTGDYYLNSGSPAIDSANADAPNEPTCDISGNARVDDPATLNTGVGVRTFDDRGAYEFQPTGVTLPTVTTQAVTNIGTTTATGNGNITVLGSPNPTQHGVVWSTSANPTIANSRTQEGPANATGAFTSAITGLTPGMLYHVRAYATNAAGTAYGEDVTFTALLAPIVTTQAVTNIGLTTATGNGNITSLGTFSPTEHGVAWSTTPNPTIANSRTMDGPVSATGPFTSSITGLTPGTLYHVRAYATSAAGTSYGEDVTFTALLAPTVTTQAVTNITTTTATGNGNITVLGVPNPTQHGVVWSTSANPTIANSRTQDGPVSATGAFTSAITGLTPGTLYHVRAYATNVAGTSYGNDVSFTALRVPTVTSQAVTNIGATTATGNGNITVLGVPNPTQHGVVWSTSANPTIANSRTQDGPVSATGAFTSAITGLAQGTLYHVRAYATNAAGTAYGEDVTFTTLLAATVTTQAVTNIGLTTATGNGNITSLGTSNPTEHGVVWSTSPNPTIANSRTREGPVSAIGAFTSSITGLTPGTRYYVRAYVTNVAGTVYGGGVTFTTLVPTYFPLIMR